MVINNVRIVGKEENRTFAIHLEGNDTCKVSALLEEKNLLEQPGMIQCENAIAFTGLINSHDHLDFNCFPGIGNRIYKNYREWGNDIHLHNKQIIEDVLKIPIELRIQWGIYKNLLNGFTTVVNHGETLPVNDPIIEIYQETSSLHSVGFEKNWRWKLNRNFWKRKQIAIHVGEGTDQIASAEIDQLIRWNIFKQPLIGIHGVAMDPQQAASFKALVWCPASNYFLLDKTADISSLKNETTILFGTDSTLSSVWNAWTQIRTARNTGDLSDQELVESLTINPNVVWKKKNSNGKVGVRNGDWVIAKNKNDNNTLDAFYALNPEDILLVIIEGKVVLFDESMRSTLGQSGFLPANTFPFQYKHVLKNVKGNLIGIIERMKEYAPLTDIDDFTAFTIAS